MPSADELVRAALQLDATKFQAYAKAFEPSQTLGEELRRLGDGALQAGKPNEAAAAYGLARSVFNAIGAANDSFASSYMVLQIAFMTAQTEEQYRSVYEQSVQQIERSGSLPHELRLNQIVLAADAAYWAASVAPENAKRGWIDRSIDRLATVEPSQAIDAGVARYASLLIADLQTFAELEPDRAKRSQTEARFSKAAASLVGRQFSFPGNAQKGAATAEALSKIADGHFLVKPALFGRKNS